MNDGNVTHNTLHQDCEASLYMNAVAKWTSWQFRRLNFFPVLEILVRNGTKAFKVEVVVHNSEPNLFVGRNGFGSSSRPQDF